jgi:hypothetical protein
MLHQKIKIKTKLIIGFSLMFCLVILTSAVSLISMNSLAKELEKTLDWDSCLAELASAAHASSMTISQFEKDIISNIKDRTARKGSANLSWDAEVSAMTGRFDVLEDLLNRMNRPEEIIFLEEARTYMDRRARGFRNVIHKIDTGEIRNADDAYEAFKPSRNDGIAMELNIREMMTRSIKNLQLARGSVNNVKRWSRITVSISGLLAVILGLAISFMVAAGIRAPLNELINNLKDANSRLATSHRELEAVHNAAERDMKIAINVQQSLLQTNPPHSNEWDIAFGFKPKSGVSGDFYEFYTDNDRIIGTGIFDVSGHGISSGLIAMLAKSIINRNFLNFQDVPMYKVLEKINSELIRELGSIDNYLTGILLRFSGDNVEYVNAGHTELLLKRGDAGVKIIQTKGDDIKGSFLGVPAMGSQFRSLNFKTVRNDTSSSRIVSSIMEELHLFSKAKDLKDDLTLIALKRL